MSYIDVKREENEIGNNEERINMLEIMRNVMSIYIRVQTTYETKHINPSLICS